MCRSKWGVAKMGLVMLAVSPAAIRAEEADSISKLLDVRPDAPAAPIPTILVAPYSASDGLEAQQAWAKALGRETVEKNSLGLEFVLVPPGKFTMGSPRGERSRDDDEDQI